MLSGQTGVQFEKCANIVTAYLRIGNRGDQCLKQIHKAVITKVTSDGLINVQTLKNKKDRVEITEEWIQE